MDEVKKQDEKAIGVPETESEEHQE
jgi:hypothetical protein